MRQYMYARPTKQVLWRRVSLIIDGGRSGLRLNDNPDLKLSSVDKSLAGPMVAQRLFP